jgi:hypothetical protein
MYDLKHESGHVKALLLLYKALARPSTDLLRSKDGKIKNLFLPPNISSLIQPMDQGVILTCKRLYIREWLDEYYVLIKNENKGIFDDNIGGDSRGQKTRTRLKEYTRDIKSAVYNWASSWSQIKKKNARKRLSITEEPEFDLKGTEKEHFHGAFGADLGDFRDWLTEDEEDFRYQNLTEEEIGQEAEDDGSI